MNSSNELRILLDSTYILPILGVEIEDIKEILVVLKKLSVRRKAVFYYTEYNIIEILGKISKLNYDPDIVSRGFTIIEEEFKLAHPTTQGYAKALELKRKGFKDLIDLLLYTTAATQNLILLTRDNILINFLKDQGENLKHIAHEESFIKKYSS